jgi:hypothetical protein
MRQYNKQVVIMINTNLASLVVADGQKPVVQSSQCVFWEFLKAIFRLLATIFGCGQKREEPPSTQEVNAFNFVKQMAQDSKYSFFQGLDIHKSFEIDCDRLKEDMHLEGQSFQELFEEDVVELKRLGKESNLLDAEDPVHQILEQAIEAKKEALRNKIISLFVQRLKDRLGSDTKLSGPISFIFSQNGAFQVRDAMFELSQKRYNGVLCGSALEKPTSKFYLTFPKEGDVVAKIEVTFEGKYSKLQMPDGRLKDVRAEFIGRKVFSICNSGKMTVETKLHLVKE